ncbi:cysteien protease [Blastocystis sp. subtype 1]
MSLRYSLFLLFLVFTHAQELCTKEVYSQYLSSYPIKCEDDCTEYTELHFPDFKKSCQHMVSKQPYTPYQMEFTMLSDFSEDDLDEVMDVKQKHSRRGSYYEPIEAKEDAVEPAFTTMDRDFCSEDAELREYAKPNDCSLSWVTMIVNAGERALAMIGGSEKLSAAFVMECYAKGDACNGLGMADIAEGLKKIGLVTEREANRVLEEGGNLCSIPQSKHFTFKVLKAEGPNRGGLMNLIGEGNPVLTLLSIDLNRLRFVKDMREEDVTLSGTVYEPSLYGLVTGYVKTTEEVDGYWVVEGTPSPCESVNVKVPMRDNETNSDYAGIAGYAFAIEFNGKRDFVVPSEGLTSVDAIPSFAQSIVFAADSFSEMSEVDFSRFRELKELVFGANSFVNVGSLELVGLHKLERLRFEVGAFANGFNLVLDDLTSLSDLVFSADCFTGNPPGRRLADVSGYGLRINYCLSIRRVVIGKKVFTQVKTVTIANLPAIEEVTIEEGALPSVEVLNMEDTPSVKKLSIAPGSLEVCKTLVMVNVAIKAESVKDVLKVSKECLKSLKKVTVSSDDTMMEIVKDLKEKLEKEVEVEVVVPTTAVPTVIPTTVAPIQPTTAAPATEAPTTTAPTTVAPTTAPTTVAPTTVAPTTVTPTTVVPTTAAPTVAPTTVAPTTTAPTTAAPTEAPITTVPPTPTPEPWFPIYDPYILGDNCNYEKQRTCYWDVIKDDDVTRQFLAVRDAYPTKALAHTRVLALSGMTSLSLELFHESLSKQRKNEAPIDTYFYSDTLLSRSLNRELIPRLMELLQYTYPSRLVFIQGTFKREGFKTMLDWMIANAHHGYLKNLKYFQVSEHNIQSCVNASNTQALMTAILSDLKTICEDKEHFPLLETINLDNNGYNEGGSTDVSAFAMQLMQACPSSSGVEVSAWTNLGRPYTKMCGDVADSYLYYDLDDEREIAQCRYTWNWELKSQYRIL